MHPMRRGLTALLLSGCLLVELYPLTVRAQAVEAAAAPDAHGDGVPEAYSQAAKLGYEEYQLHNYAEARARFLDAHHIYPNARSLRALGAVEYDLQNYPASIEYLQSALASDVRPLEAALRAETEQLLERARGYVAVYTFVVEPAGAQLELDGERVELRPDHTLLIKVGDHQLGAQAPGFVAARRTLRVQSRADDTVRLKLAPALAEEREKSEPVYKKWWLWTIVGVVAAGAATGLAVGLSGREKQGEPSASNLEGVPSIQALRWGSW